MQKVVVCRPLATISAVFLPTIVWLFLHFVIQNGMNLICIYTDIFKCFTIKVKLLIHWFIKTDRSEFKIVTYKTFLWWYVKSKNNASWIWPLTAAFLFYFPKRLVSFRWMINFLLLVGESFADYRKEEITSLSTFSHGMKSWIQSGTQLNLHR